MAEIRDKAGDIKDRAEDVLETSWDHISTFAKAHPVAAILLTIILILIGVAGGAVFL